MSLHLVLRLIVIVLVVVALGGFYLITHHKRKVIKVCVGFVIMGFLLYTAGFLSYGDGFTYAAIAALRGLFSTARMFFANHDHSAWGNIEGAEWLTGNNWMLIIFWLCHLSAVMIIQAAVISLFGRRFVDIFRLRNGQHREVFFIKGSDKYAILLGQNIATHDGTRKHPDKNRIIAFLLSEDDDEKKIYERVAHFRGVTLQLGGKKDILFYLDKARVGSNVQGSIRQGIKCNIVLMPNSTSLFEDTYSIAEYGKRNAIKSNILDIFILSSSEWDRERIDNLSEEMDGSKRKYPYTFHIISETDLLVRQMIKKHPPCECPLLRFDDAGVAARDFTVMILGFGSVGQSALLRLIMNGQFVGSRMRAIIVDREADLLKEHFLHRYPSFSPDAKTCCNIDFKSFDVRHESFYTLLTMSKDIDYIVVSLGDDAENKVTAIDLMLHYERWCKDIPFIAVYEESGGLHARQANEKIFLFGCRDEVYKESVIIREETNRMAEAVQRVNGERSPWHTLSWFDQENNRAAADHIPTMLRLAGVTEDEAKSMRRLTEDDAHADVLSQTELLRKVAFFATMGYLPQRIDELKKNFEKPVREINEAIPEFLRETQGL